MLPRRFVLGFQAVDELEDTGIWKPALGEKPMSRRELDSKAADIIGGIKRKRMDPHQKFIWNSLLEEVTNGVGVGQHSHLRPHFVTYSPQGRNAESTTRRLPT